MGSQSLKRGSPSGQLFSLAEATAAGPPAKFETLAGREPASSPSPSMVEVARTQGTQVDRQGPKHTWTTVFDQRQAERVFFWLRDLDYKTRNAQSHRRMKRVSGGKDQIRYTRHVTVRSTRPAEYAARSLESEEDWDKARTLALRWWGDEERSGVEVHVTIESGSGPKPEPSPMFRRKGGWSILEPAYGSAPPTPEAPRETGHERKRARKSPAS